MVITPHVAAASEPSALVPEMLRQIEAYEAGAPLTNLVDRDSAY